MRTRAKNHVGKIPSTEPMWTLTGLPSAATRVRLRALLATLLAAVCVSLPVRGQQEAPFGAEPEPTRAADPGIGRELRAEDSDDDPDSEVEVEKSAAELEAVRKA